MKGAGAVGIAGVIGGSSSVMASEHDDEDNETDDRNDTNEHEDEFAAVRVGNLAPDIAMDDADLPGRGPPMDTPGRPAQRLRSTALDLYVGKVPDGNPTIGGIEYPQFGPGPADSYLQVPAREYDIAVTLTGDTEPLLEETIDVEPGYRYTALAAGRLSPDDDDFEFQPIIIEDAASREETIPAEGMAEASFVHASPNAGPVDIAIDGVTALEDVEFGDVSPYQTVPPNEYEVEILSDGDVVLSLTRELISDTRITFYVTGLAGVDEFPDEDGRFGLSGVATVDGLNPLPEQVLTR